MQSRQTFVQSFFQAFEANSNSGDVAASVAQFADVFLAGDPVRGMNVVRAGDFAQALPKRKQLFDQIGCRSTELVSVQQTELNSRFTLATTQWRMNFAREGKDEEVLAGSIFVIDTAVDPFRIVLSVANQDIMAVLTQRGILRE